MTKLEEAVAKAASEMSREAKAELAHQLIAELSDKEEIAIDDAWLIELRRRMSDVENGCELLDGDEVERQAHAMVKK
jgi:hypothetical protein